MKDAHGLELSTDSAASVAAWDHLIDGFLRFRAGRPDAVRLVTERVAARRPIPLARHVGWQEAARLVGG